MEPTNHPFRKENDLPNLHYCVPCYSSGVYPSFLYRLQVFVFQGVRSVSFSQTTSCWGQWMPPDAHPEKTQDLESTKNNEQCTHCGSPNSTLWQFWSNYSYLTRPHPKCSGFFSSRKSPGFVSGKFSERWHIIIWPIFGSSSLIPLYSLLELILEFERCNSLYKSLFNLSQGTDQVKFCLELTRN